MSTNEIELEVIVRSTKLSLLKALGVMMKSPLNLSTSCLCAAAVAARILTAHELPFSVQTGYLHLPGFEYSIPHVWLVSVGDAVTDITFSGPERKVLVLGQAYAFHEPAERGTYDLEAKYPILDKALPVAVLREQAANFDAYLNRGPEKIKQAVEAVLQKALDGSNTVEL